MSEPEQPSPPAASASVKPPMLNRAAWVRIIPFLVYIFFIVAADMLGRLGFSAAELRWLYPVKIFAVVVTLVMFYRHYTELHSWRVSPIGAVCATGVGVVVFILWINFSSGWLLIGTPEGFDPRTDGQIDWLLVAIRIAGAALVVPIMEELFWRSFLMRWMEASDFEAVAPAAVRLQSVMIAAVLFGFEHNQWLAGVAAGVAYSVVYMRQGSLWSAILAHAVTNGVLGLWIVSTANWTYW